MKLYTNCSSCREEIRIKSLSQTRHELQMEKSREFDINCPNCGVIEKKHINDVKAQNNKMTIILGILIGIVVTIGLWVYFGAIGTISFIIPILFWNQENRAVKSFNSYLIKR